MPDLSKEQYMARKDPLYSKKVLAPFFKTAEFGWLNWSLAEYKIDVK